jgi:hypothetical protein
VYSLSDLGLAPGHNQVIDVFAHGLPIAENVGTLSLKLVPRSVQIVKVLDTTADATAALEVEIPENVEVGKPMPFSAKSFFTSSSALISLGFRGWNDLRRTIGHAHLYTRRECQSTLGRRTDRRATR